MVDKSSQASGAPDTQQIEPQSLQAEPLCQGSATEGCKTVGRAKGRGRKPKPAVGKSHAPEATTGSATSQVNVAPTYEDEGDTIVIGGDFVGDEPPDDPNYVVGKIVREGLPGSISDEADRQKKRITQLTAYENSFERAATMARQILGDLANALHKYTDVADAASKSLRLANDLRKTIGTLDLATRAIHEHRNKGAKHRVVNYIIASQGANGLPRGYPDPSVPAAEDDAQTYYFERIIHEINDAQEGVSVLGSALHAQPEGALDTWVENCRYTQRYLIEAQVACNKAFDYHRAGGAKTTAIEHEKVAANSNAVDQPPPIQTGDALKVAG